MANEKGRLLWKDTLDSRQEMSNILGALVKIIENCLSYLAETWEFEPFWMHSSYSFGEQAVCRPSKRFKRLLSLQDSFGPWK